MSICTGFMFLSPISWLAVADPGGGAERAMPPGPVKIVMKKIAAKGQI